ncbi:hypothetical protein DK846_01620 [Methanospirillum lacunae]|uniref:Uncharacterized protein n=1 Tax=Methanospirillum lacunae TaxID=668570 RepID=A0A2V2N5L3_9EURY|nr:hypothetical protein DK846_01620 [Methanospirillum lacunae]
MIFNMQLQAQESENYLNLNSSNNSIPPSKDPLNKTANKKHKSREKTGYCPEDKLFIQEKPFSQNLFQTL